MYLFPKDVCKDMYLFPKDVGKDGPNGEDQEQDGDEDKIRQVEHLYLLNIIN